MARTHVWKEGFTREMRIVRARDYERIFRGSRRSTDVLFTVLARRTCRPGPRLGIAVSRKHAGNAVNRNRVKRRIRESFRRHQRELRGLDVVVVGRDGLRAADGQALFTSLERHWRDLSNSCRQF